MTNNKNSLSGGKNGWGQPLLTSVGRALTTPGMIEEIATLNHKCETNHDTMILLSWDSGVKIKLLILM